MKKRMLREVNSFAQSQSHSQRMVIIKHILPAKPQANFNAPGELFFFISKPTFPQILGVSVFWLSSY